MGVWWWCDGCSFSLGDGRVVVAGLPVRIAGRGVSLVVVVVVHLV